MCDGNIDMKRLTIIIPVYNAEKSIIRCVESILSQMAEEDELILLNDGSSDNSLKIIREYEKKYSCVRGIDKENTGVAETRNLGIDLANGKYLLFVDNDDYIEADYLDRYYNAIETGNYDCVLGGYRRVSDTRVLFEIKAYNSDWYKLMLVAPWAKIYRTSFIKEHQIHFLNYSTGEDTYFNILMYSKSPRIGVINYTGYNWWFNNESVSNTSQRGFNSDIDILYLLNCLLDVSGKEGLYKYYYLRYIVWHLLFSGRMASSEDFLHEYKRCFKWLAEKGIGKKYPLFSVRFKPEPLKNRIAIKLMVILDRTHLMSCFAKMYCKG